MPLITKPLDADQTPDDQGPFATGSSYEHSRLIDSEARSWIKHNPVKPEPWLARHTARRPDMTNAPNPLPFSSTTSTVRMLHRSIAIDAGFEPFTAALEKILGHFPRDVEPEMIARPQLAEQRIKAAEGAERLMIILVFDHGAALNNVSTRVNAKQRLCWYPPKPSVNQRNGRKTKTMNRCSPAPSQS
jgi:hypothetical protein